MYEVSEKSKRTLTLYQKQWTELLSTVSIKPIKIARTWMNGITPGRRLFVSDYHWNKPYQYRECMHNEIPYDLDVYNYELLKMELQPTLDFLNSEHIPYVKSGSGGNKSIHVQLWFKPTYYCVVYGWREVRFALFDWILDQANIPMDMRGDGQYTDYKAEDVNYPYDRSVSNFSDQAQGRVMRDFGGHARGKKCKTLIVGDLPETREEIYDGKVRFPSKIDLWDATKIIEEMDLKPNEPKSCKECPVMMEWVLWREADPDQRYQYPSLCRECGKVYET